MQSPGHGATPSQLRQEVAFLTHKLAYQQSLLDDERRITDDLLTTKNKAIEAFQQQLADLQTHNRAEVERLQRNYDQSLLAADQEWRQRFDAEVAKHQQETKLLKVASDDTAAQLHTQLSDLKVAAKKELDATVHRMQEDHRKSLRRMTGQMEGQVQALQAQHQQEMDACKQEARAAVNAANRKLDQHAKSLRKDFDAKLDAVKAECAARDETIADLKDKCVLLSRATDKKVDEMTRAFSRDFQKVREKANQDIEDTRRQAGDLVRKLEQRCFRVDSEKQAQKVLHDQAMDDAAREFKEQLAAANEEKFQRLDAFKKEADSKMKTLQASHQHDIQLMLERHNKDMDAVRAAASTAVQQIKDESRSRSQQQSGRIAELEQLMQKLRMQTVLQDSYWRKKEQQVRQDAQAEVNSLKAVTDSLARSDKAELGKARQQLAKQASEIDELHKQLGISQNQITELRIELDARTLQHREDIQNMTKRYSQMRDELSQSILAQEVFQQRSQDLARDLAEKTESIQRLQSRAKSIDSERQTLAQQAEILSQTGSASASPARHPRTANIGHKPTPRASRLSTVEDELDTSWKPVEDTGPRVVLHDDDYPVDKRDMSPHRLRQGDTRHWLDEATVNSNFSSKNFV